MRGDISQDAKGHFFRDNGDGTSDALSLTTSTYDKASKTSTLSAPKVTAVDSPVVLVRDGAPTGAGDKLAARIAVGLARRYA
jgi:hypothetical protein